MTPVGDASVIILAVPDTKFQLIVFHSTLPTYLLVASSSCSNMPADVLLFIVLLVIVLFVEDNAHALIKRP